MGLKSTLGGIVGLLFLAMACLSGLFALYWVGVSVLYGLTVPRATYVFFALGGTVTAGFVGYFVRKVVAGQVMPSKFDVSVAYRGGP